MWVGVELAAAAAAAKQGTDICKAQGLNRQASYVHDVSATMGKQQAAEARMHLAFQQVNIRACSLDLPLVW